MVLYKYLTPEKAMLMLEGKLFLTPAKFLNDPWEFYIRSEKPKEETIRGLFEQFQREYSESQSPLAIPTPFQQLSEAKRYAVFHRAVTSDDFRHREPAELREELSSCFGVISLTEDPLSRLMWAHYAQINQGVVVGFNAGEVQAGHGVIARPCPPLGLVIKVRYEDTFEALSQDFSNVAQVFHTKHVDWKYEAEWRIIRLLEDGLAINSDGKTLYFLPLSAACVVRIIFGLSTEPQLKEKIRGWLAGEKSSMITSIEQAFIDPATQQFKSR
jgi:hypothetical protein